MIVLESLLAEAQRNRHIGEMILVIGLAAEIALIAFVDWIHVGLPSRVLDEKRKVLGELLSALLIVVGVYIENRAGNSADDIIRRMRAARMLTVEQQASLVGALKPFAGQRFSLAVTPLPEPVAFAQVIDNIVKAAGWELIGAQRPSDTALGRAAEVIAANVHIDFTPHASPEIRRRARLLASMLSSDGDITASAEPDSVLRDDSAVDILVGTKE